MPAPPARARENAPRASVQRPTAPRPSTGPTPRNARRLARALLPWVVPAALLVIWQTGSSSGLIPPATLPALSDVIDAGTYLAETGDLQRNVLISLRRIAIGFALGATAGLLLGFAVGMSAIAEGLFDRSLQMVRTIPHLALVPLMIAWFGIGELPKVLLVALGTLFPVYLNTVNGIRGVDPRLIELGRSYGLGPLGVIRRVVVPGALPSILTGIRYALGVAWLTLVVAETIASRDGIGFLAQNAREQLRTDQIVLAILLYALAGFLADLLVRLVERFALPWHPHFRRGAAT
ncbi:ABC transporter permease [Streptomyces radicis]|uniref:ABC transporter permease subunit n=1 Tax=Streptomyces radicis TaxID=1750517 RepID=A0A3A9W3H6_9ACTN|nr:ABC transporter permease subunit [Streptomyces radicis]RKN07400.1 ABC transporter permease subunit [Streptomyces radicis]RKN19581.1 ABC transporter permease subunit [Streptomyces radicis]